MLTVHCVVMEFALINLVYGRAYATCVVLSYHSYVLFTYHHPVRTCCDCMWKPSCLVKDDLQGCFSQISLSC